jgi:hypothetical protein
MGDGGQGGLKNHNILWSSYGFMYWQIDFAEFKQRHLLDNRHVQSWYGHPEILCCGRIAHEL